MILYKGQVNRKRQKEMWIVLPIIYNRRCLRSSVGLLI